MLPTDVPGPHYQGDVRDIIGDGFDLMVAHPPCTFLSRVSARHLVNSAGAVNSDRWAEVVAGAEFFREILEAPIPRIAVENPIMLMRAQRLIGVPFTQVIQPWQHGDPYTKATALWLKNLPPLSWSAPVVPTSKALGWDAGPTADRWKIRSATYPGIARAMADQWSESLVSLEMALW